MHDKLNVSKRLRNWHRKSGYSSARLNQVAPMSLKQWVRQVAKFGAGDEGRLARAWLANKEISP